MADRPSRAQRRFALLSIPIWLVLMVVATLQYLGFIWRGSQLVATSLGLVYWVVGGYLLLLRKDRNRPTETGAKPK